MAIAECNKLKYSSSYHGHTNKSFKKLTKIEQKQVTMLSMIHRMGNKARVLGCLRNITNEILCNCAYHDKNIEEQFKKLSTLKVPKEEMEIITDAWELKNNMGKSLLHDLKELIDYVKSSNNS